MRMNVLVLYNWRYKFAIFILFFFFSCSAEAKFWMRYCLIILFNQEFSFFIVMLYLFPSYFEELNFPRLLYSPHHESKKLTVHISSVGTANWELSDCGSPISPQKGNSYINTDKRSLFSLGTGNNINLWLDRV